jgi:arabinofuranosyltransferase
VLHSSRGTAQTLRIVSLLSFLVPIIVIIVAAWDRRWISDDGFINLRVVQQLIAGHGPVFNQGERVEIATSPLWIGVLFVGSRLLPWVRLEWIAVLIGLASTAGAVLLAELGALRLLPWSTRSSLVLPLGALAFVALPPVWDFSTSGLEVSLSLLWLATCFYALSALVDSRRTTGGDPWRRPVWLPMLLGLGPLIRPDFATFSFAFVLLVMVCFDHDWPARLRTIGAALVLPCAYELFRAGYYGALVPNTAFTKEAGTSRWDQGVKYLFDFNRPYQIWIPLLVLTMLSVLPAVMAAFRRARPEARDRALVVVACVGGALLEALYVVRVGGDFMHARMLIPALFALVLPATVVRLPRWPLMPMLIVLWAVVVAFSGRVTYPLQSGPYTFIGPQGIADERGYYAAVAGIGHPVTLSDYHRSKDDQAGLAAKELAKLGPRPDLVPHGGAKLVLAAGNVGMLSYAAGPEVYIWDDRGLGDVIGARLQLLHRGRPGHEKHLDTSWLDARFATPGELTRIATSDPELGARVNAARQAIRCGSLSQLIHATTDTLTVGRFLDNMKIAVSLYSFRLSNDPALDEARFCASPTLKHGAHSA